MNLEAMLEELNDSDVTIELRDLASSVDCLESVETEDDFRANVDSAIAEAEALLKSLRNLKGSVR